MEPIGKKITEACRDFLAKLGDCKEEPCKFAPESNLHPPFEDGEKFCDGNGYLCRKDGAGIYEERCSCFLQDRRRNLIDGYWAQLNSASHDLVFRADLEMYAYAKAKREFRFQTPGILLHGMPGGGKTIAGHLLMVHDLIPRYARSGFFWNTDRLRRAMRATAMGDESQRAAANAYQMEVQSKCAGDPIVYVDDIGRADGTETFREGIYDLVRALEERRAVCVLTSNLTEKGILSNLRDDVSSRLFNREWITRIEVDPQDIRPTLEPRETQEAFA